jgi:hypothetical protein
MYLCVRGHVYVLGVMYMCSGSCICARGIDFVSVSTIIFVGIWNHLDIIYFSFYALRQIPFRKKMHCIII